jgi:hypothetical protein
MSGMGVAVTAYTAHGNGRHVHPTNGTPRSALDDAARARRDRTEAADAVTAELRTEAVATDDFV